MISDLDSEVSHVISGHYISRKHPENDLGYYRKAILYLYKVFCPTCGAPITLSLPENKCVMFYRPDALPVLFYILKVLFLHISTLFFAILFSNNLFFMSTLGHPWGGATIGTEETCTKICDNMHVAVLFQFAFQLPVCGICSTN